MELDRRDRAAAVIAAIALIVGIGVVTLWRNAPDGDVGRGRLGSPRRRERGLVWAGGAGRYHGRDAGGRREQHPGHPPPRVRLRRDAGSRHRRGQRGADRDRAASARVPCPPAGSDRTAPHRTDRVAQRDPAVGPGRLDPPRTAGTSPGPTRNGCGGLLRPSPPSSRVRRSGSSWAGGSPAAVPAPVSGGSPSRWPQRRPSVS